MSFKEITRAEIINYIIGYGKTVLISTDVYPPPKMVRKLATTLNAKIHGPNRDMSVESKVNLVESYLSEVSSANNIKNNVDSPQNDHERDALAAAIRTYKKYQVKLLHAENRSHNAGLPPEQVEDIKIMLIEGKAIGTAIQSVIELNHEMEVNEAVLETDNISSDSESLLETDTTPSVVTKLRKKIRNQERQINNLKARNGSLEGEIKDNQLNMRKLQSKLDKLYYQYNNDILYKKEVASKISLIAKLQEEFNEEKALRMELEENLKSMNSVQLVNPSENSVPVKIIENFTREGILKACEYWKIKRDDIVLLKNSEGGGSQTALLLINMGVRAVLIMDKVSHYAEEEFERNMVPLLQAETLDLKIIDQFAIVNPKSLEMELDKWKVKIENKLVKENTQEILNVIDEYRAKRRRLA